MHFQNGPSLTKLFVHIPDSKIIAIICRELSTVQYFTAWENSLGAVQMS